ncbi:MAG: hypothetical protein HYV05_09400 [Deltaproteobacteria bacterium]|nr:hypothetical protein [Deltaproteobacteria bacterium]
MTPWIGLGQIDMIASCWVAWQKDFYRRGFIDQLSRVNTGRVFYTSPDQIGNYIVVDYIANKRKRIGRT